ncbi:MAG TPA: class I SAM-dependent methyltransferase [Stellaceae bacterium]|nr:class I SAM-dependent methyltransferase [Stellaceae bacterium]
MSVNQPSNPSRAAREHYVGEAGRSYHERRFAIPDAAYDWVARSRSRKIAPQVSAANMVVEFGVGHGWNLAALECHARIGFDVGAHVAPIVRDHGIAFVERAEELRSGSADVLICHHVLEHVPEPAETLAELRRILSPAGRLLLFVPYETERRFRRYTTDEPDHHLFSWTPQSLGNLVHDCGFAVTSAGLGEFGYDRIAAVWAYRLRLGELGFRLLRRLALTARPAREVRVVATKREP